MILNSLFFRASLASVTLLFGVDLASGQVTQPKRTPRPAPSPTAKANQPQQNRPKPLPSASPTASQPMKKAAELISKQPPITTNASVLQRVTPDNAHVIVSSPSSALISWSKTKSRSTARSRLASAATRRRTEVSPSSKKTRTITPVCTGDYKDSSGRTVRGGVSARIDSAPSGTHFVGASMKWFMRLTGEGVGMHVGILPGYPASHGCIRMPEPGAAQFYSHVKVGTPVRVDP